METSGRQCDTCEHGGRGAADRGIAVGGRKSCCGGRVGCADGGTDWSIHGGHRGRRGVPGVEKNRWDDGEPERGHGAAA